MDNLYKIEREILYKELIPLWEKLSSINYAVVKGEVLSQQIYGEPDRRQSNDIDILIDKKNIKLIETELKKIGFEQYLSENGNATRRNRILCLAYSHQIPSYHKDKFNFHLNVDVNYDIFWGEYEGHRCSMEDFLNDTLETDIYGIIVKTLTIEKAFVQLILHHYKEMNSLYHLSHYNCIRTHMFKDIYDMLLFNRECLTVEKIRFLCENYSIGSIVYYMIYYMNNVFKDAFLNKYLSNFESYKNDQLIRSYGLNSKERKLWKISFEERLDNDNIWCFIDKEMTEADLQKIALSNTIFI